LILGSRQLFATALATQIILHTLQKWSKVTKNKSSSLFYQVYKSETRGTYLLTLIKIKETFGLNLDLGLLRVSQMAIYSFEMNQHSFLQSPVRFLSKYGPVKVFVLQNLDNNLHKKTGIFNSEGFRDQLKRQN